MVNLDFAPDLLHILSNYRDYIHLSQDLPDGPPFLDENNSYLSLDLCLSETFVVVFFITVLLGFVIYLFGSSTRRQSSRCPSCPSHGPCKGLNTHGVPSPRKGREFAAPCSSVLAWSSTLA